MDTYRLASTTQAMGSRARASMLTALVASDGLPARALASEARVTAQTASSHLAKLLEVGLVTCERRGRQRYYRLRGPHVVHAIDALAALAPHALAERTASVAPADPLHEARTCYDHLGGTIAVALADALVADGWLIARGADYETTGIGARGFRQLGVSVIALRASRRAFARACPDWSARRPHLGGALGAALTRAFIERGWLLVEVGGRAVRVTAQGREGFATTFGVRL